MEKFRAERLLQAITDRGYPGDYLRARLRGRRSRLVSDWHPLLTSAVPLTHVAAEGYRGIMRDLSAAGAGVSLALEYRWVYSQMNGALRVVCAPFFLYSELRTLFACLRFLKEKKQGEMRELLSASLLSDGIKKMLLSSREVADSVRRLESEFLALSEDFAGLADEYAKSGLRDVEKELTERFLSAAVRSRIHPAVRQVFRKIIDARNIINVYKWLNLKPEESFAAIPGGLIPADRLSDAVARDGLDALAPLLKEFHHALPAHAAFGNPEPALYRGITAFLGKAARDPSGVWPILDYLWRCSIEAMNLNLIIHAAGLPRERVAAEVVQ